MEISLIKEWIESNEIEKASEAIENLSPEETLDIADFLHSQLRETNNNILRNVIALALADCRYQQAAKSLIELIQHKKTKNSRGTLLYALGYLDYEESIEELLPLLADRSYEVSRETYNLLEPYLNNLDEMSKKRTIENMEKLIDEFEEEIEFREHIITLIRD